MSQENNHPTMRAKLKVISVTKFDTSEQLKMVAVSKPSYDDSGLDEDNTFAKFSPSADFSIHIANPALLGKFEAGQTFYVDFIRADA